MSAALVCCAMCLLYGGTDITLFCLACVFAPVADIPGIIEGAHCNKGLGLAFLKHIERCSSLLYVIDISKGCEQAMDEYEKLCFELEQYQEGLSKRPAAIIATKVDIADNIPDTIKRLKEHSGIEVRSCSSLTGARVDKVKLFLRQFHRKAKPPPEPAEPNSDDIVSVSGTVSVLQQFGGRIDAAHSQ